MEDFIGILHAVTRWKVLRERGSRRALRVNWMHGMYLQGILLLSILGINRDELWKLYMPLLLGARLFISTVVCREKHMWCPHSLHRIAPRATRHCQPPRCGISFPWQCDVAPPTNHQLRSCQPMPASFLRRISSISKNRAQNLYW